jgi:hypothetical protein
MALIVAAELVQALQVVSENFLMKSAPSKIPPVEMVG